MEHGYDFLKNLSLVLGVAAVATILFHRLKQPVILGYLLAGIIIGPHVPIPLIADPHMVHTLAELGMILLMFSMGLEFSIRRLVRSIPTVGFIALLQCSAMVWIGYVAAHALGWTGKESFYMGAMIAISSTAIIVKAFEDSSPSRALKRLVFGILIVEDLIAILLLTFLTTVSTGKGISAFQLLDTAGTLTFFLLALLVLGMAFVPRMFRKIVAFERPEITLIAAVGFCFTLSLLVKHFGYSVALGAFLAGALVAESGEAKPIEHLVQPVRDIFAAVFFVAVGMLIEPQLVLQYWPAILLFTVVVVVGKVLSVALGAFLTGHDLRLSLQSGMSLAQIGEFSFIIAGVGLATGATRNFLYPIAVAVCALTTLLTPWLVRYSDPLAVWTVGKLPRSLRTFVALYGSWTEQLKRSRDPQEARSPMRRLLRLLLMDYLVVLALSIGAALLFPRMRGALHSATGLEADWIHVGLLALVVVLLLPFLFGLARVIQRLGLLLAYRVLPAVAEKTDLDLAAAPRSSLVVTLQITVTLLVALSWLALIQPLVPLSYTLTLAGLLFACLGLVFWRRTASLHGHVKAGTQVVLEALTPGNSEGGHAPDPIAALQSMLPGLGQLTTLRLLPNSGAIGKTLSELDLRSQTGVTVLAITRAGLNNLFPPGAAQLEVGDRLTMTGSEEAIRQAREWIQNSVSPS